MYIYIFLTFTLARSLFLALDVHSCIYIHVSIYVFTLTFRKLYHRAHVNTFAPCLPNSSTCACVCMCTSEHVCVYVCVCGCIVCAYVCDLWMTRFHQVGAYIHSRNGALVLALWVFATLYHQDEYIHTDMRTLTMPAPIPFVPPVTKQFLPANVYRLHVGSMGVGGGCVQISHLGLDQGFQCVTYVLARNSVIFIYTHISHAQYCETNHTSRVNIPHQRKATLCWQVDGIQYRYVLVKPTAWDFMHTHHLSCANVSRQDLGVMSFFALWLLQNTSTKNSLSLVRLLRMYWPAHPTGKLSALVAGAHPVVMMCRTRRRTRSFMRQIYLAGTFGSRQIF